MKDMKLSAGNLLFFLTAICMVASAREENPFYEYVRSVTRPESGIFCGTYRRAMDEVDLQLELLESGNPQEFRQKHKLKLSSCSLQLLVMMKESGDTEAAQYLNSLEEESNVEIIYVIYRSYYDLGNEIEDRQFHNKGIEHKYMPKHLQQYWSAFFKLNVESDFVPLPS